MHQQSKKHFVWVREDTYQMAATIANDTGLSLAIVVGNLITYAYEEVYGSVEPGDRVRSIFVTKFPPPIPRANSPSDPPAA